jgi:hypothetical protein
VLRLLLGHRLFRQQVDQVQSPLARNAIPILIRLLEVIAGIEKQNRNPRIERDGELRQQHVFGLKAARQAHIALARQFARQCGAHMSSFAFTSALISTVLITTRHFRRIKNSRVVQQLVNRRHRLVCSSVFVLPLRRYRPFRRVIPLHNDLLTFDARNQRAAFVRVDNQRQQSRFT